MFYQSNTNATTSEASAIAEKANVRYLMCETPNHRLASPRLFPDKNRFLRELEGTMKEKGYRQGDLC